MFWWSFKRDLFMREGSLIFEHIFDHEDILLSTLGMMRKIKG
jgi:hypothetical protein